MSALLQILLLIFLPSVLLQLTNFVSSRFQSAPALPAPRKKTSPPPFLSRSALPLLTLLLAIALLARPTPSIFHKTDTAPDLPNWALRNAIRTYKADCIRQDPSLQPPSPPPSPSPPGTTTAYPPNPAFDNKVLYQDLNLLEKLDRLFEKCEKSLPLSSHPLHQNHPPPLLLRKHIYTTPLLTFYFL